MFSDTSQTMRSIRMLQMGLHASTMRRAVISDNIANADTPGFKRQVVSFESELSRRLHAGEGERFVPALTDPRHLPFTRHRDWREVRPRRQLEWETSYRNDRNNIDIEKEMVDAVKNAMRYNLMVSRITGTFRSLEMVMG